MASPNIWQTPGTYEIENRAFDPDGLVAETMRGIADWSDRVVLDVGCGTGFHLPWFAEQARRVVGVEPHPDLVALARRRTRHLDRVTVVQGTAQQLPVPDGSVDIAHARWAYFFGPGCEPGLAELARVVRRGGTAYVLDNDPTRSTFGGWFRRGYPHLPTPSVVERFWSTHGWTRSPVLTRWRFGSRADLASVVAIELPTGLARQVLAEHQGVEVDYAVNLWWRRF